jgi:DNA-binding NtrC family response regulator
MDPTLTISQGMLDDMADELKGGQLPGFVLLWSRDEPHRTGEVALVPRGKGPATYVLGRAEPAAGDPLPRLTWIRQRPGRNYAAPALNSPRVSREQLKIETRPRGMLQVTNIGRCPLWFDGKPVTELEVGPGDVLELQQQLLLLVVSRPAMIPSLAHSEAPSHPFGEPDANGIVGESEAAWALRDRVAFASRRAAHVLIRGASGTGKELVAQAIHNDSSRGRKALVSRNAATFPETLIDAELFGNARNYPNPGMPERVGLVGEAEGSSLFLDEFGELPSAMQAHLLRVLDSGEYTRLGESRARRSDFRLIAATNRPESSLKEDVLARLRLRVEIPDLNDRVEDIPRIAIHVLRRMAAKDQEIAARFFPNGDPRSIPRLSISLVSALVKHEYATHVRELEALLLEAMAETRGDTIEPSARLLEPPQEKKSETGEKALPGVDPLTIPPEVIQESLDRHGGRQEPVWRELGLSSRHVLTRLVRRYDLQVKGRGGKKDDEEAG